MKNTLNILDNKNSIYNVLYKNAESMTSILEAYVERLSNLGFTVVLDYALSHPIKVLDLSSNDEEIEIKQSWSYNRDSVDGKLDKIYPIMTVDDIYKYLSIETFLSYDDGIHCFNTTLLNFEFNITKTLSPCDVRDESTYNGFLSKNDAINLLHNRLEHLLYKDD